MGNLLYNENDLNIHSYCTLLKEDKSLNIKYCPYLLNPLSKAGCYLTKGIDDDTTKRKEISNTVNSLEALGFINRNGRILKVTKIGVDFVSNTFESEEGLAIIRSAICNYGVAVGLIYKITQLPTEFNINDLNVGYPDTNEFVDYEDEKYEISAGSKGDSNTRTKSCLIAWLVTAGIIIPKSLYKKEVSGNSIISTNEYIINNSIRNERIYLKGDIPNIFGNNFITNNPLSYGNLTKNSKALRENGQDISRQQTMALSHIIKNRRFVILYALNYCYKNNLLLNYNKLINVLMKHKNSFIINDNEFESVMRVELNIAYMGGIPYVMTNKLLQPLNGLNENILKLEAPIELITLIDKEILPNVCELQRV